MDVDSEDGTQVLQLGDKCFYPLNISLDLGNKIFKPQQTEKENEKKKSSTIPAVPSRIPRMREAQVPGQPGLQSEIIH